MRALPLVLGLLLLLPLAHADQSVGAGPASLVTQNNAWGDGDCDAAANGGQSRYAKAGVALTPHDEVAVVFSQSCGTWSDEHGSDDTTLGSVQAGRFADGNAGPVVQVTWMDQWYAYEWGSGRTCFTSAYLSGVGLNLGCMPNGERVPMAPELP